MSYQAAKARLDHAESKLQSWDRALRDPRKFKPVVKCEWDRAFDAREVAKERACRADPIAFSRDFPSMAWIAVYLGLTAPAIEES